MPLQELLGSLPVAALILDSTGMIEWVNPEGSRLLHHSQDALQGQPVSGILPGLQAMFGSGATLSDDGFIYLADGTAIQARPLPWEGKVVLLLENRSDRSRLQKARTEFVANVSHELLTPITSIRASLESLEEGAIDDLVLRNRFIGHIHREASRLESLLRDLLSLAELEGNLALLEKSWIPVAPAVEAVHRGLANRIAEKGIAFRSEIPTDLRVKAHPSLLEQVLVNLVENGIKYNIQNGQLSVGAARTQHGVELWVQDSGPGILEKYRERVFERFFRIDKHRSRAIGGTGLGLAIVKHIAEKHGGTISLDSEPGKGSTFRVWFPDED